MSTLLESGLTDSRQNDPLVDTLLSLRQEAEESRRHVESSRYWKDVEDSYYNRLLENSPTPEWMSREVAPMTWSAIEHIVPTLTDSRPRLLLNGRGPEDAQAVKFLGLGVAQEEDRQQMPVFWTKCLRDAAIGGSSFVLTRIDLVNGLFRLRTEMMSRWAVYADPLATSDVDLGWVWIKRMVRGSRLVQMFPERANEILQRAGSSVMPSMSRSSFVGAAGVSPNPMWGQTGMTGSLEFTEITRSAGRANPLTQYYELWEAYFLDRSMIPLELQLNDRTDSIGNILPATDTGAIVTMVGDLVVHAMDNPFRHGDIPLTRLVCYDLPGQYYGMSFIEALLGPHRQITRIDNKVTDWMVLACDPETVIDDDAGVDTEEDFAAPGKKVVVKPASRYERIPPSPMPQYVWNLRMAKQQDFKDATGQQDVNRGAVSGSAEDMSGKAIDLLQDPGERRLRLFQRNFEATVSRWGRQTVSNLMQFHSREQWLRVLPPGTQQLPWEGWSDEDFRDWPDVTMAVGSSLPVNKTARQNAVIQKYQAGLFGRPGSLQALILANQELEVDNLDAIVQGAREDMQQAQSAGLPPGEQADAYAKILTGLAAFMKAGGGLAEPTTDEALKDIGLMGLNAGTNGVAGEEPAGLAGAAKNKAFGAGAAPGTED